MFVPVANRPYREIGKTRFNILPYTIQKSRYFYSPERSQEVKISLDSFWKTDIKHDLIDVQEI